VEGSISPADLIDAVFSTMPPEVKLHHVWMTYLRHCGLRKCLQAKELRYRHKSKRLKLSTPFHKYGVVSRALVGQASRPSFWTGKMPVPPSEADL
jgi:hypothetical protein